VYVKIARDEKRKKRENMKILKIIVESDGEGRTEKARKTNAFRKTMFLEHRTLRCGRA